MLTQPTWAVIWNPGIHGFLKLFKVKSDLVWDSMIPEKTMGPNHLREYPPL